MKISTKGRYALRIMLDIAEQKGDKYVSVRDISVRQNITIKYMEQIISTLHKAGYLVSFRGNSGGYKLAKTLEEYIIGDILRLMEGSLASSPCTEDNFDCPMKRECRTNEFWAGLDRVVKDYIDSKTLRDLMPRKREIESFLL